ncbi:DUF1294 domain-containing protein [Pelagibacterium limicola]|uniref:DUF1294 domain-containing protein n=1 Tax=Pelagibacterium limicola TaxID=2791022 RepID=UPI0018AFAD1D|nr:cold shock and DUF1294 domain-containing protein [Pelagibacterium limicola]
MEYRGVIASWNDEKGFGFIRPEAGGGDIFFHISDFLGTTRPIAGHAVEFEIGVGRQGKHAALRVRPRLAYVPGRGGTPEYFERDSIRVWLATGLIALAFAVAILDRAPILLTGIYLAMGAGAFGLYWLDKKMAGSGGWRVSEASLHLVDMAFGSAGGLLAQQVLRHKTSKPAFAGISYLIAGLHVTLLGGLLAGLDVVLASAF